MNNEYIKIVDFIDKKIVKDKNGYFYYDNIDNTRYKTLEEALLDFSNACKEKLYYEFKPTEVKTRKKVK